MCRARLPRRCATRSLTDVLGDGRRFPFDASEHWFRCRFTADPVESGEEIMLRLGGIATIAEVFLNGEKILQSNSMFASHEADVSTLVRDKNELLIVCRLLTDAMRDRRRQPPVARWRTRVVAEQQLRWFRTTLLGRAPGFAPEPEPVGPWRPITLVRRRRIVIEDWTRHDRPGQGRGNNSGSDHEVRSLETAARPVGGRLCRGRHGRAPGHSRSSWRHTHRPCVRFHSARAVRGGPILMGSPTLYPVQVEA